MIRRIGIVNGGGDCPGLNAVIRAVAKAAAGRGWQTFGVFGGYEGLLAREGVRPLDSVALQGLLVRGGTILGTCNSGPFAAKVGAGQTRGLPAELLDRTKRACADHGLDVLVCIGGDGTLSGARQFHEHGIPVVGVPKTIDNDLDGTTVTFGFDSAVACATDALDRLHSTAESHGRVMVLEVMGRHAGWIGLYSGVAGGADVILLPEIPFAYDAVCAKIDERRRHGKHFTIVVAAEGAKPADFDAPVTAYQTEAEREVRLGGIAERVVAELERRTKQPCRAVVLGHLQRGGSPTNVDRALATMFGAKAVELAAAGRFGRMVAHTGTAVDSVTLAEATERLRVVPQDDPYLQAARSIGICFGEGARAKS